MPFLLCDKPINKNKRKMDAIYTTQKACSSSARFLGCPRDSSMWNPKTWEISGRWLKSHFFPVWIAAMFSYAFLLWIFNTIYLNSDSTFPCDKSLIGVYTLLQMFLARVLSPFQYLKSLFSALSGSENVVYPRYTPQTDYRFTSYMSGHVQYPSIAHTSIC